MANLDLNQPIHWEEIEDYDGPVTDLNFDLVLHDSDEGITRDLCSVCFVPLMLTVRIDHVYLLSCLKRMAARPMAKRMAARPMAKRTVVHLPMEKRTVPQPMVKRMAPLHLTPMRQVRHGEE